MSMLKRWWWVAVVVVAVVVVGAFLLMGQGGPAVPAPGGQASGTQSPGAVATTGATEPATGTPSDPSAGPSKPSTVKQPKLAAKGSRLATITAPPSATFAQLRYTASRDGQAYDVAFKVYGKGPIRSGHGTVVAAVSSFQPAKTYSDALKLPSDNVLLELGPGVSLTSGGGYTGVVTLTKRGDALVLVLTKVKAG